MEKKIQVLMCGSEVNRVKGGMVSVIKNYLFCKDWENVQIHYVPTHMDGSNLKKAVFFAVAYLKILVLLLSGNIDVAHLHMAERGSFFRKAYLTRLLKRFRIPVLLHHHGAEFFPFYESLSEKKKQYVQNILQMADYNLILSEFSERQYLKIFPGIKTKVLLNAVPVPEENSYLPMAKGILTLGKLGQRKGTYDLLKAISILDRELPKEYRFYLCGDGEAELVQKEAARLGIMSRIAHIGWVDGGCREDYMTSACLHVLPSYFEGLPMSILETMARGIPNVATRIASIPEVIVNGENGILVEPGDIAALVDAIRKLIENSELRRSLSYRARETVETRFSFDITRRELQKIYAQTVEKCK